MKLPSKYIALLVILSLAGIFGYQAYWLTGLYRTMRTDLERNITEAMRISDYNEMLVRIERLQHRNREHGEVSISTGFNDEGKQFVQSSTVLHQVSDTTLQGFTAQNDTFRKIETDTVQPDAMLHASEGLDMLLRNQSTMAGMAIYLQRGLHSGLDILMNPSFTVYDSLLHARLLEMNIPIRYRLQYLHEGYDIHDRWQYTDTVATGGTSGYVPTSDAVSYQYEFSASKHEIYRLTTEPLGGIVLRQMAGILTTSLIILLILGFSFWYLIRTILRQKTLEEMKSDFTNNITHELKTPIAVAYAATDALLNFHQADNPTKRERYLRICQEQLQHLSRLVEQILSMSMEQRKNFRLNYEEIDLKPMLETLIRQHQLKADKPMDCHLAMMDNTTIYADRTHLYNMISNLIDNAVKYSGEKADICISVTVCNGYVTVKVSDKGIGIPGDKQKHLFDKFYRVPTGNLHNVKGYGLGLYYVKTMAEQHKGSITVESSIGKGSTFILEIPGK